MGIFGKKKKKDEMPMQKIDLGVYEVAYTDEVIELRAKMSTQDKSAPEGEERYKWVKGKYSWKECLRAGSVLYVRIGLYLTDYLKAVGEEAIQKEKEKLAIVCAVRFQTFNLLLGDQEYFTMVSDYLNKKFSEEKALQDDMSVEEFELMKQAYEREHSAEKQ